MPLFRRAFYQIRHSVGAYTAVFTIATTFYYIFWGAIFSIVSALEKRYSFASWQSGLFLGAAEYGRMISLLPVSYLGGRSHVPRLTAICMLILAVVLIMIVSPHFILEPTTGYNPQNSLVNFNSTNALNPSLCLENNNISFDELQKKNVDDHKAQAEISKKAFTIFMVAVTLLGVFAAPLTNISMTYIDINASAQKAPLYIGIANSAISFGPMIGAFVSAWASTIYVDLSDPPITPNHPDWVGAWWISMVTVIIGTSISAPFLFIFPKQIKTKDKCKKIETEEHNMYTKKTPRKYDIVLENSQCPHEGDTLTADLKDRNHKNASTFKEYVRTAITEFIKTYWRIISNPLFLLLTVARIAFDMALWGHYAYLSRYMEVQFSALSSTASIVAGISILCIGVSNVSSGLIITFFKLTYKRTTFFLLGVTILLFVNAVILMFIGCPNVVLSEGKNTSSIVCMELCNCNLTSVSPVCEVASGLSYLSPCNAGCKEAVWEGVIIQKYSSCICTTLGSVVPGICSNCSTMPAYIVLVFLIYVLFGFFLAPCVSLTIRSVEEKDRGIAMALHILALSVTAWQLYAYIYGVIIDSSCDLWQDLSGFAGYCQIFNRRDYRFKLHGASAGFIVATFIFMLVAYFYIRRRNIKWEKDDENTDDHPDKKALEI